MSAADPREARVAFLLGLRERGIRDLAVLRALETIPRENFVPHRYLDLANRDIALPIACGQSMPQPYLVARMMVALQLSPAMRVLEIGAGSGYATAILARLAGEVTAVERFQSLAIAAGARLAQLAIGNAQVAWGDGLDTQPGPFDRIVVHAGIDGHEARLVAMLGQGGFAVGARGDPQQLMQLLPGARGAWRSVAICPARLRPLIAGCSRGL